VSGGKESDPAFAGLVVVRFHVEASRDRPIRDDEIKPVARNIGEQLVQIIFETHDPEFVPVLEGVFENAVGDQFCDRIDHAHIQLERRARFAAFHTLGQFGAESENLVRILVNDLTRLGQAQATADPLEQRFVDRFFEQF
jgi:hypothetical protein